MTMPGVGPVIATAVVATAGEVSPFASGREFAACVGLAPP
jgi:transposase